MGWDALSGTSSPRAFRTPSQRSGRTAVVIGDGELAVALRDRLDRAYLTLIDVRPVEASAAVDACLPWPWMVIGDTGLDEQELLVRLHRRPVLVLWHGRTPLGLPAHARAFDRFTDLATAVEDALRADVEGVRLAPGGGLTMPDGAHAGNAGLEALVAGHPRPLWAPAREFRGAAASLQAHRVGLRVARQGGATSLVLALCR